MNIFMITADELIVMQKVSQKLTYLEIFTIFSVLVSSELLFWCYERHTALLPCRFYNPINNKDVRHIIKAHFRPMIHAATKPFQNVADRHFTRICKFQLSSEIFGLSWTLDSLNWCTRSN